MSTLEQNLAAGEAARTRAIVGCILGTAVGDSVGLPYEGLSRRRAQRFLPGPVRQRLLFGRGMISDDTEHTAMVALAILDSIDDRDFARQLGAQLRRWFWCIPAGIGLATLRACLKLTIGIPPDRSGTFSAGNGPAMRAAILGAAIDDLDDLTRYVTASTRVTHTDPRAEFGALAVALASRLACEGKHSSIALLPELQERLQNTEAEELLTRLNQAAASVDRSESTLEFADSIGLGHGVTGYVNHTVPVALHACWRYPHDFQAAVEAVIRCGGDADTTAAITGGIVGTAVGKDGIPTIWIQQLRDWPRSVGYLQHLGQRLAERSRSASSNVQHPRSASILARNAVFTSVVLIHGLRRLLPPY